MNNQTRPTSIIPQPILSPEDSDLGMVRWGNNGRGKLYCKRMFEVNGERKWRYVHHLIFSRISGRPMNPDEEIDHIDGNPLNNTRGNLRVVSHKKNMENLAAASRFRGTCWDKRKGMWMAKVTHNYRTCFCGYFHDRDEAAKAAEAKRRSFDFLTSSAD